MFESLINKVRTAIDPAKTALGRLAIVQQDLANIDDVQAMVRMSGWRRVRRELEIQVVTLSKEKFGLETNPKKNHDQILEIRSLQSAIMRLLSVVDENISKKFDLLTLETEYLAIIETADLQRKQFSPGQDEFSQEKY